MLLRVLAFFLLLLSILFMPWWVSAILALGGMIYFNKFFEAAVLFLLSDLLFGAKEAKFNNMIFVSFIMTVIIFIIVEIMKKKLKFYPA
ncbi:MAG: hypothetical protein PHT16_02740 [Candidatus Pacebacteria bacterium]|nr:hypothetical protein [Candidatus Paceibacterota bacterium]